MSEENIINEMENLFLALADKTRLRLLNLMRRNEVCVYYLAEVLGENQPKISRHLAYLKNMKIVTARRDGKWIYYKIAIPENKFAAKILENTLEWLESQSAMQEDYKKLIGISGANGNPDISFKDKDSVFGKTNVKYYRREELDIFLL